MSFDLNNLLNQYLNAQEATSSAQVTDDFEKVKSNVNHDTLASAVATALQSEKTLPFATLVRQFFEQANPQEKADILNQLISGINPAVIASIAGGVLGAFTHSAETSNAVNDNAEKSVTITPETASEINPASVEEIATHAEKTNPNIIDAIGQIYAKHSRLINSLGIAALTVVLNKIAREKTQ